MIDISELARLQRALDRFMGAVRQSYPGLAETGIEDLRDDASETIRNAATAEAYIGRWIQFRRNNKRDPFARATGE